tara:strand:- start:212 stop:1540 length:1329 start_codon:yes stop_codon:yes gene_type:complete
MTRPEMMAIGDSLYNGVRSLSIAADLARWSVPAQVANALGIPFTVPDYPRNVIVNMERWLRMFPDIGAIKQDVKENVKFWLAQPASPSGLTEFDNIAIASTTFSDMLYRNSATADYEVAQLRTQLGNSIYGLGGHLAGLFFAFNTKFLLNPTNNTADAGKSSLDIVRERKPKRLLVSIGSNNGLWSICFDAKAGGFTSQDTQDAKDFMDALRSLPAEIEHIYLNSLPPPSTVSNLMPIPDYSEDHKPPANDYFSQYENRFGFSYGSFTKTQMRSLDAQIELFNNTLQKEADKDPRIHLVRMDKVLKDYDSKHRADASKVKTKDKKTLSNVMTEGAPRPFPSFRCGGLQGLDGMHPTIVGYTLMARQVLETIKQYEGLKAASPDIDAAYRADTLLRNVPRPWSIVLWLWRDFRRAAMKGDPTPTGHEEDATRQFMEAVQFKIN